MSRTRLDEIVEEEIPRESHYTAHAEVVRTWGKRIAERAFRHGVYRGAVACRGGFNRTGDAFDFGAVQPAPAEEKGVRSKVEARTEGWTLADWAKEARSLADQIIYDEDTKRCLLVLAAKVAPAETDPNHGWVPHYRCHVPGCNSQERRKGQRRKETNWPENYVHPYGPLSPGPTCPIFQMSEHGAWYYDRRSGQERRASGFLAK